MSPDAAILAMQQVSQSLQRLASLPSQVSRLASEKLQAVVDQQVDAETDPYGKSWKPLMPSTVKRKGGDTRILRDTDKMLASLRFNPMSGAGVSVTIDSPAEFHQIGTKNMAARPILPRASVPDTWERAIADAAEEIFDRWAEGAQK